MGIYILHGLFGVSIRGDSLEVREFLSLKNFFHMDKNPQQYSMVDMNAF